MTHIINNFLLALLLSAPLLLCCFSGRTCYVFSKQEEPPPKKLSAWLVVYSFIMVTQACLYLLIPAKSHPKRFEVFLFGSVGTTRICLYAFFYTRLTLTFNHTAYKVSPTLTCILIFLCITTVTCVIPAVVVEELWYSLIGTVCADLIIQVILCYSFVSRLTGLVFRRMSVTSNFIESINWDDRMIQLSLKQLILTCVAISTSGCLMVMLLTALIEDRGNDPSALLAMFYVSAVVTFLDVNINYYCMLFSFKLYENWYGCCCKCYEPCCKSCILMLAECLCSGKNDTVSSELRTSLL